MASTSSNLSELTVTCSQCGSASLERIGPREYRCNHCGAITVVTQDGPGAAPDTAATGKVYAEKGKPIVGVYPGPPVGSKEGLPRVSIFASIVVGIVTIGIFGKLVDSCASRSWSSSSNTAANARPATPSVPLNQLTLSPAAWMSDPASSVRSGHYVSMLYNHSPWPILVPRYTMTLYTDGIRGPSATSESPLPRLLPGEYEPVSFSFETPGGNTRSEITPPLTVQRADGSSVSLPLTEQQLVRQADKPEYRLVGLVGNTGKSPVKTVEVLVTLFGANRTLIGYGAGYAQPLRPGERAAIDVHIPTANVQPVLRYEYLVDATAEDK